ncbi:MAG: hypothetical protein ACTSVV_10515 [Promethearchaeota archaeon]
MKSNFKFLKRKKKIVSKNLKKYLINNKLENVYTALQHTEDSTNYYDFSTSEKNLIGYLKGSRIPEKSHLLFNRDYRAKTAYHGKIGKLLNKSNLCQYDMQKISALLFMKKLKDNCNFIVTDEICKYYSEDNYSNLSTSGELHNSCMRYEESQNAIEAYEIMGKNIVKLLVLLDDNKKVLGRALLWYTIKYNNSDIPDNAVYMDRIYAINDNVKEFFINYAEKNNFVRFVSSGSRIFNYKNYTGELHFNYYIDDDIPMPYFDTFQGYNLSGIFSNYSEDVSLESTSYESISELNNNNLACCGDCGTDFDSDYEGGYSNYSDEYLCDCCGYFVESIEDIVREEYIVSIDGANYLKDDCIYSDYHGEYYHKEDENICYSEYENDYINYDELVFIENRDEYVLCENAVKCESDDEYYLTDDENIIYIKEQKAYYLKSDDDIKFLNEEYHHINNKNMLYCPDTEEYILFNEYEKQLTLTL